MDLNRTGGVKYDHIVLLPFSKAIGADGTLSRLVLSPVKR